MHTYICKLDMILLISNPENLLDGQLGQIRKILKSYKHLQSEESLFVKQLYIKRYQKLEVLLTNDIDILFTEMVKYFIRNSKMRNYYPSYSSNKIYDQIIETNRLHTLYVLKEPRHKVYQKAHLFDVLDMDLEENSQLTIFNQISKVNKSEDGRVVIIADLIRKRFTMMERELMDRNQNVLFTIKQYNFFYNRKNKFYNKSPQVRIRTQQIERDLSSTKDQSFNYTRKISQRNTPKKQDSNNKLYLQDSYKLIINSEPVVERKIFSRSIYCVRKIHIMEDVINQSPISRTGFMQTRKSSKGLIKARYQKISNSVNTTGL